MSAIIISAILILVATVTSFRGFFGRSNILETEFKERSVAISEACADQALLQFANDIAYGGGPVIISGYSCTIGKITTSGSEKTFKTQASFQNSYTNLEIKFNTADFSIISWKEIAVY